MGDPFIDALMQDGLRKNVFPGAVLLVGRADRPVFFEAYGLANRFSREPMARETVFDLASLTKPLATTLAAAWLIDRGCILLDQPVADILPPLSDGDKAAITPRQLLCHRSGLPAHQLFYMTLRTLTPTLRKAAFLDLLKVVPMVAAPDTLTLYSDLGFMLLCRLIESVAGCPLDHFLADQVYAALGVKDLFFVDLFSGRRPKRAYAATELCPVRHRLLIGEVHDDNAWFAGGVDGHAGLFGTAEAVFQLLRRLVADMRALAGHSLFSRQILGGMLYGTSRHGFTLGFDRPAEIGSSAGDHFSAETVGHLGFTGTSFWMDLKQEGTVILLTNRVHPFRWNTRLRQFRPMIHNAIMERFFMQSD